MRKESSEPETELKWIDNIDLFELLDANGLESIGFREFSALVFLLASYQSNQLLQCLYQHGALLFDIVGGGQQQITAERAKSLSRLVGISDAAFERACSCLFEDLGQSSLVNFESFQLLYHELFGTLQQSNVTVFPVLSPEHASEQINEVDG